MIFGQDHVLAATVAVVVHWRPRIKPPIINALDILVLFLALPESLESVLIAWFGCDCHLTRFHSIDRNYIIGL